MKRQITFRTSQRLFENSLYLYLALAVTMLGLLSYAYFSHQSVLGFYEKASESHRLSVLALLLSEENYHTQLEIYEVFSVPDAKRIDDFHLHERLFSAQLNQTYEAFRENRDGVSPEAMAKLESLRAATPRIRAQWHTFLAAVQAKRSIANQIALLETAESTFDEERFNEKIREIVELQLKDATRAETDAKALTERTSAMIMAGMLIAFLLTCVVAYLHRSAMRGKTHEIQLVQAGKLASLGQLSAGMAHELNSPLMFIRGFNGRIRAALKKQAAAPSPEILDYLDEVDAGVERISRIVRHFRDFSRLSKNEMTPTSINTVVTRAFTLFAEQLRLSEVSVDLDLDSADPLVLCDANRIEQVFLNLISNARDALREIGETPWEKKISVATQIQDSTVVIRFSDTGSGIAEHHLSRIFDPFFTTKPMGTGTGLGLSISAGIVRDHRGKIDVESSPGQGTQFTLTFPRFVAPARLETAA